MKNITFENIIMGFLLISMTIFSGAFIMSLVVSDNYILEVANWALGRNSH